MIVPPELLASANERSAEPKGDFCLYCPPVNTVWAYPFKLWQTPSVTSGLDDRIRELCAQAIAVDATNFEQVLSDLRSALREHLALTRQMALQQMQRLRHAEEGPCQTMPASIND